MRKSILIMSGKGGVGKTTIAVNLAYNLYKKGFSIGILDVDIHGPNVLKMLGYDNVQLQIENNKLIPLIINSKFKVASIAGYFDDTSAIIWRGPRKHSAIKQLSQDVAWGNLNYLIVDFPPGTGDEHISSAQLLTDIYGAVIVSTPQKVSLMDMGRSIDFCNQMKIPILGALENMSGDLFGSDSVQKKCDNENIKFLGKLPLSKTIINSSEKGKSFIEENNIELNKKFEKIVKLIIGGNKMKIAITANGEKLSDSVDQRFGRCLYFLIVNIEGKDFKLIEAVKNKGAIQGHSAGITAAEQIGELEVDTVITGQLGPNATNVLKELDIKAYSASGIISDVLIDFVENKLELIKEIAKKHNEISEEKTDSDERIFFPLLDNKGIDSRISQHFGHAPFFGLYEKNKNKLKIIPNHLDHTDSSESPIDQIEKAVNPTTIFAKGIGSRAIELIKQKGLNLKTGNYEIVKDVLDNLDKLEEQSQDCGHTD